MSAVTSGTRLAATGLQGAGLLERDQPMRDATDKPGGRKGTAKNRTHRNRDIDMYKDRPAQGPSRIPTLSARGGPSATTGPMAIRGASKPGADRRGRRTGAQNMIPENGITSRARPANGQVSTGVVEIWRAFVQKRYNPTAQFLNLENMADDEDLRKNNIQPPGVAPGSVGARVSAAIFKLAAELQPEVRTLSLANNNIPNGGIIAAVGRYLPNIANLSLQGNKLERVRDLDIITGRKGSSSRLTSLKELILIGNPCRENEVQVGKYDEFRHEVARRIPSLEMLDQLPVVKIAFDVPEASSSKPKDATKPLPNLFPCEMGGSLIAGVDGGIISNFLGQYFNLYDTQRGALQAAYHASATFSFSCNTTIPVRSRLAGFQHSKEMPNQTALEWGTWLNAGAGGSRNLERVAGNPEKSMSSLHIGSESIMRSLAALPGTIHEVAGAPEKFCIDAWPVGSGETATLFVNVHGQFAELPSRGIRSFDRSFVLAPAAADTPARAAGWDVVILSDQLCIRAYSSHEMWAPGPMRVQATDPLPPLDQLAPIPEPQRTMVVQFSQRTGLNVKFTVDCLEMNGWDLERAAANFEQVKGTLGKDAYL